MSMSKAKDIHCSFCGKSKAEVSKLLSGLDDTYICDGCVDLSYNVLKKEDKTASLAKRRARLRKIYKTVTPKEIHAHLNEH